MNMTTDENDLRRGAPAPTTPGTCTVTGRPVRMAPAILIREHDSANPDAGIEVALIGVDGLHLDTAVERIRALLERYATVVGREIVLAPLGHPDAPCGYLATGVRAWDVNRAIGGAGALTPTDAEGRW